MGFVAEVLVDTFKKAMFTSSVTAFSEAASFSPASCVADGLLPVTEDSREREIEQSLVFDAPKGELGQSFDGRPVLLITSNAHAPAGLNGMCCPTQDREVLG